MAFPLLATAREQGWRGCWQCALHRHQTMHMQHTHARHAPASRQSQKHAITQVLCLSNDGAAGQRWLACTTMLPNCGPSWLTASSAVCMVRLNGEERTSSCSDAAPAAASCSRSCALHRKHACSE